MGKVKLTLTVEEAIVSYAKDFAKKSNQSISKMFEEYLSSFSKNEKNNPKISIAKKLHGIGGTQFSNMTADQIKDLMYKDKYGL